MTMTKLENLINPQVMGDMISAELPKAIKFSDVAVIDSTLEGRAGNTITVPKYEYIGDAVDVAEGVDIDTTVLTTTSQQATVKKVAKAVQLTDESVLSAVGNPVGETNSQLVKSIASKIDNDILDALKEGTQEIGDGTTAFAVSTVSDALDVFEDEELGERKFLFVNPKHMGALRKSAEFSRATDLGDQTLITGAVGMIYGCEVVPTRKIEADEDGVIDLVLAKEGAVAVYLKRDVQVETARNIINKTTTISADEHYVAVLHDDSKVVRIKVKA